MHLKHKCLLIPILLLIFPLSAYTYWPTTVDENLLVAADPDTIEKNCVAIPFTDGSVLIAYCKEEVGHVYQIIDRYGECKYDNPPQFTPGLGYDYMAPPKLLANGEGGAFVAYVVNNGFSGIYSQCLDSLGNRSWGDSGVRIFPIYESDFDISLDGMGGFLLAVAPDTIPGSPILFAQRIDGDGNLLWGNEGVLVSPIGIGQKLPRVTRDGRGGAFVLWEDHRFPFGTYGALFVQHLDEEGNRLWGEDIFVYESPWFHQIISDGEGGCIIDRRNQRHLQHAFSLWAGWNPSLDARPPELV